MQLGYGDVRDYPFNKEADAIGLSLSEPDGQNVSWQLDVYAALEEGRSFVGSLNTCSANFVVSGASGQTRGNRVVAYAFCPGARAWRVLAKGPAAGSISGNPRIQGELRAFEVKNCPVGSGVGVFRPTGGRLIQNGGRTSIPITDARLDAQGPCSLLAMLGSNESSPGVQFWVMAFNATSLPPNGTQPWQGISFNVPAGGSFSENFGNNGVFFPIGMVWSISSTGDTLTHLGSSARVQTFMGW